MDPDRNASSIQAQVIAPTRNSNLTPSLPNVGFGSFFGGIVGSGGATKTSRSESPAFEGPGAASNGAAAYSLYRDKKEEGLGISISDVADSGGRFVQQLANALTSPTSLIEQTTSPFSATSNVSMSSHRNARQNSQSPYVRANSLQVETTDHFPQSNSTAQQPTSAGRRPFFRNLFNSARRPSQSPDARSFAALL